MIANLLKEQDPDLTQVFKERLKYRRDVYKAERGVTPLKAATTAIFWDEANKFWDEVKAGMHDKPKDESSAAPEPEAKEEEPKEVLFDPAIFKGKECPDAESIRWAAQHISAEVKITDAPSILAVGFGGGGIVGIMAELS